MARPIFSSPFSNNVDESPRSGKRPVVFDVLGPDHETSILPPGLRMVLHVNPTTMRIQHSREVTRIQTRGGYVEQHWGDNVTEITFDQATGGFMRLFAGLSNITNPSYGGTRRETIAYDKYVDFLALFHNNGAVMDSQGKIVLHGCLKVTFDGGVYLGWFSSMTVAESADKPFQFQLSSTFTVSKEIVSWRSTLEASGGTSLQDSGIPLSQTVLE